MKVLERRQGVNMRVNTKQPGATFGEVSLLYTVPRSATVAATLISSVWVLERSTFRCETALLAFLKHHVSHSAGSDSREYASSLQLFLIAC